MVWFVLFSFSTLKYIVPPASGIISNKKSAVILSFIPQYVICLFLPVWLFSKCFSLSLVIRNSIKMYLGELFSSCFLCMSLRFLVLFLVSNFHQIWKTFSVISLNIFFCSSFEDFNFMYSR